MLKDKIKADFKEAFKAKEQVKLSVLKMVNSEIGNAEINKRAKLIKGLPAGEAGGKAEKAVLMFYMPEQLTEEKIRELAKKAMDQSGAKGEKEIGKVMALLSPQVKGKADGALVNKIVRELLG